MTFRWAGHSVLVIATLALCGRAFAQAPTTVINGQTFSQVSGAADVAKSFDACSAANVRTEFDRTPDLLGRMAASCRFYGGARFHGKGDPLRGDSLEYDADKQTVSWTVDVAAHSMFGGNISPVGPILHPNESAFLSFSDKMKINALGNETFLLLPVESGTGGTLRRYDAQNSYGAKVTVTEITNDVYAIAIPLGRFGDQKLQILHAALPIEKARDLLGNLDIEVDWVASQPCAVCYTGGEVERDTGEPTIANPNVIKTNYRYVYAAFAYIKLIDRRDGSVYLTYRPGS